jgi:hypothetical protein
VTATGRRHRSGNVVARGVVRVLAVAELLSMLGSAIVVGLVWVFLSSVPSTPDAWLWLLAASGVLQLAAGLLALVAFGYAR